MGVAVVKEHVLGGGGGVAEAVADIPAEGHAVYMVGGGAPVPGVVIGPDTPAPVQNGEALRWVEHIGAAAIIDLPAGAHTVDLLVEIKMARPVEGGADDQNYIRYNFINDRFIN